jgi:hypothetical protein
MGTASSTEQKIIQTEEKVSKSIFSQLKKHRENIKGG